MNILTGVVHETGECDEMCVSTNSEVNCCPWVCPWQVLYCVKVLARPAINPGKCVEVDVSDDV